ncbi:hypothetical protein [Stenotrophomonas lactitubi]|uniref:hypothetical protein n=1 Tax=Stenotrophomonas lactitubi TaxID=2045214 RepID=UPI00203CD79F|nr:hypothetical protein [Stenotrophomonas lactitubi]
MSESTFISDAQFTKYIGVLKQYPISLFDQFNGGLYLPNRLDSLFQDAAMTIPVTAPGDPVGAMLDLSGRENHWLSANPGTYQVANGRRVVRFSGTAQGMYMRASGREIFSGAQQGLVILRASVNGTVTGRHMFRANVQGGNVALLALYMNSTANNMRMGARRLTGEAESLNSYPGISGAPESYTFDVDWFNGRFDSYKNGSGLLTKTLESIGGLPQSPVNGMFLANYDSTGYAAMDFHGGAILAGVGNLSAERERLEQWIAENS